MGKDISEQGNDGFVIVLCTTHLCIKNVHLGKWVKYLLTLNSDTSEITSSCIFALRFLGDNKITTVDSYTFSGLTALELM